jgi:hypothetical protein
MVGLVVFGWGFLCGPALAQAPAARYRAAKAQLAVHSPNEGFLDDDSPAAVEALAGMWRASADAVVELLTRRPDAS